MPVSNAGPLKFAIIGAGNFGTALLKLFRRYGSGHQVIQLDKCADSDDIENLASLGDCDVVIPAVPISRFSTVLRQIAPVIKSDATIIDVCTIKEKTTADMLRELPETTCLISMHPLFGPESLAANKWNLTGLKTMIWPTRIEDEVFERLVEILENTGLIVVKLSPRDHDLTLANSQFLSLLIGALLVRLQIDDTPINTRSFDELLDVKATTQHDYAILQDVFRFNPYCRPMLEQLQEALSNIADDLQNPR